MTELSWNNFLSGAFAIRAGRQAEHIFLTALSLRGLYSIRDTRELRPCTNERPAWDKTLNSLYGDDLTIAWNPETDTPRCGNSSTFILEYIPVHSFAIFEWATLGFYDKILEDPPDLHKANWKPFFDGQVAVRAGVFAGYIYFGARHFEKQAVHAPVDQSRLLSWTRMACWRYGDDTTVAWDKDRKEARWCKSEWFDREGLRIISLEQFLDPEFSVDDLSSICLLIDDPDAVQAERSAP